MNRESRARPFQAGSLVALLAAVTFGVTAPLIKLAGQSLGPFSTAALLYGGAALFGATSLRRRGAAREAPVKLGDLPRLVGIALFGAVLAPAALAWALQHTSAALASLLLNAEVLFTVLLARMFYSEHMGRRVALAVLLMVIGSLWLVGGADLRVSWGGVAAACAALGWALDNTLGRPLADRDPAQVVFWKATLGALASTLIAISMGESPPAVLASVCLLLIGATGYGLSLRLYLQAQRALGAARTGSIFSTAPFVGAVVAVALGEPWPGARAWPVAGLFAAAIYLHFSERHRHMHRHEALEHEHAHRHDDGHHDHAHEPPFTGTHNHAHRHEPLQHDHEHGPDLHHQHGHAKA